MNDEETIVAKIYKKKLKLITAQRWSCGWVIHRQRRRAVGMMYHSTAAWIKWQLSQKLQRWVWSAVSSHVSTGMLLAWGSLLLCMGLQGTAVLQCCWAASHTRHLLTEWSACTAPTFWAQCAKQPYHISVKDSWKAGSHLQLSYSADLEIFSPLPLQQKWNITCSWTQRVHKAY